MKEKYINHFLSKIYINNRNFIFIFYIYRYFQKFYMIFWDDDSRIFLIYFSSTNIFEYLISINIERSLNCVSYK